MRLERNFSVIVIPLLAAVCLLILGCHTAPKGGKFNIEMAPGGDIKTASVEVDLIGATEREKSYWETYPIDKYWEPEDPGRRAAEKFTVRLDDGKVKNLPPLDPIWDKWLGRGGYLSCCDRALAGGFQESGSRPAPGDTLTGSEELENIQIAAAN
jgi:hypothetical protein